MQHTIAVEDCPLEPLAAPSLRTYAALIGVAALSSVALHMVRFTTAADLPDALAQHSTLPIDQPPSAIDTSLQPFDP